MGCSVLGFRWGDDASDGAVSDDLAETTSEDGL